MSAPWFWAGIDCAITQHIETVYVQYIYLLVKCLGLVQFLSFTFRRKSRLIKPQMVDEFVVEDTTTILSHFLCKRLFSTFVKNNVL